MKPNYQDSKIYIALPALAEMSYIPKFFDCVRTQTFKNWELVVCVNQPEIWWNDKDHLAECENNQDSLIWLEKQNDINLIVIDKSSKGKAWFGKKVGVGWARKTIMDFISTKAEANDIILSLDADTTFEPNYFQSIISNFIKQPKSVAISVPYYHPLTKDSATNRDILRYEIYMRYYALNLWRINNPYNFSALGSAIAVPVWAYKKVGGISPHKSGEDFYFLLKLRKFGMLQLWNSEKVFPAARYSNRVLFGTGPAMIKGATGDWASYPIYDYVSFDQVEETYASFGKLYREDIEFPMKSFLSDLFKDINWHRPLRKNSKTVDQFIKACQHKVDALRILQYLKFDHKKNEFRDEDMLSNYLQQFHKDFVESDIGIDLKSKWTFDKCATSSLNALRNYLATIEEKYQRNERL
jgi:glycosyltransferase involved in cell wall biosynthesis